MPENTFPRPEKLVFNFGVPIYLFLFYRSLLSSNFQPSWNTSEPQASRIPNAKFYSQLKKSIKCGVGFDPAWCHHVLTERLKKFIISIKVHASILFSLIYKLLKQMQICFWITFFSVCYSPRLLQSIIAYDWKSICFFFLCTHSNYSVGVPPPRCLRVKTYMRVCQNLNPWKVGFFLILWG